MQDHGLHMPQSRIKAMWRKVDIDSSGSISSDEFRRALDP
jgi:Ca2+-binding EF-hand superfamily protein